jgi:DNA-binding transcriptional MocR family regulator
MKEDNSTDRVTQSLRALVQAAAPGARLPSVRELQTLHRVSPLTVRHATAPLVAEGLIVARPGQGTFVNDAGAVPTKIEDRAWQSIVLGAGRPRSEELADLICVPQTDAIPLSCGYLPADLQATGALSAALSRAGRRPDVWGRMAVEGLESLRGWFARELQPTATVDEVLICSGGQAALATIFRALTRPGDAILVESPTYIGALAAARAAELQVIPVPMDENGVRPELLEAAIRATGAKVFYCQPRHANPSGAILSADRRPAVIDVMAKAGAFLIEDDWARDLQFEGTNLAPLAENDADGHVVYIRSLTKPAAPGLRIAAVIARGAVRTRLKSCRITDDFFVAGPLQEAALQLVSSPAWIRHLRAMRAELILRRNVLIAAIRDSLPEATLAIVPKGGFHVWIQLPDGQSDIAIARAAAQRGLVVSPGSHWFPAEAPAPFLRLTFAAAPPAVLRRGIKLLGELLLK